MMLNYDRACVERDALQARVKELAEILAWILDDMPEDWKKDERAWSIGLLDRARAVLKDIPNG